MHVLPVRLPFGLPSRAHEAASPLADVGWTGLIGFRPAAAAVFAGLNRAKVRT